MELTFDPEMTVLVGENNAGKSTVGIALQEPLLQLASGGNQISTDDYPDSLTAPLRIEVRVRLPKAQSLALLSRSLSLGLHDGTLRSQGLRAWLNSQEPDVVITVEAPPASTTRIRYGEMLFEGNFMSVGDFRETGGTAWVSFLTNNEGVDDPTVIDKAIRARPWDMGSPATMQPIGNLLLADVFKRMEEFRSRAVGGSRTGAMESMSGSDIERARPDSGDQARFPP